MNNLHRELAPISDAAWAQIEEETSRTLKRYLAGRRVVDVQGPAGTGLSAVGTGHLRTIAAPKDGIVARQREVKALVELRVPFELDRHTIDDVERGANDSDWQPAKDAARQIAFAEDGADIRRLCRRRHRRHASGDQQSEDDASCRRARVPASDCRRIEPVAARRRQRPVRGAARCRRLHCARRNERPWISGAGARQDGS